MNLVRQLPPNHGVWRGKRYQTESFDRAVRRGEIIQLGEQRITDGGEVHRLYRRIRPPAPRWHKPAQTAGIVAIVLGVAGVGIYIALRALLQVASAMMPLVMAIPLGAVMLLAFTRINHRGACPGITMHCKGCR